MADKMILLKEAQTILTDRAQSLTVSMFATSGECHAARVAMLECASLLGDLRPAETIVHCKECRYWGSGWYGETEYAKECKLAHYMVGCNGYCVYGEKRHEK